MWGWYRYVERKWGLEDYNAFRDSGVPKLQTLEGVKKKGETTCCCKGQTESLKTREALPKENLIEQNGPAIRLQKRGPSRRRDHVGIGAIEKRGGRGPPAAGVAGGASGGGAACQKIKNLKGKKVLRREEGIRLSTTSIKKKKKNKSKKAEKTEGKRTKKNRGKKSLSTVLPSVKFVT